jgi:hypothetical protein
MSPQSGVPVDWDGVHALIENPPPGSEPLGNYSGPAATWSPQLDEALRCCEEIAKDVGIMMTPVLVIDGEVKHLGSVSSRQQIRNCLFEN